MGFSASVFGCSGALRLDDLAAGGSFRRAPIGGLHLRFDIPQRLIGHGEVSRGRRWFFLRPTFEFGLPRLQALIMQEEIRRDPSRRRMYIGRRHRTDNGLLGALRLACGASAGSWAWLPRNTSSSRLVP